MLMVVFISLIMDTIVSMVSFIHFFRYFIGLGQQVEQHYQHPCQVHMVQCKISYIPIPQSIISKKYNYYLLTLTHAREGYCSCACVCVCLSVCLSVCL